MEKTPATLAITGRHLTFITLYPIEQAEVIRKILEHLGLWGARRKPVPRANAPPMLHVAEDVESYFPTVGDQMVDPIYPVDAYF